MLPTQLLLTLTQPHSNQQTSPMGEPAVPTVPTDLQARLDAAGATDDESLRRVLGADPDLKRDYLAFLEANQEQITRAWMAQLLAAFLAVSDSNALAAFWQQVPVELEDTFIAAVEGRIAQAEQSGESDLAEGLRERLDGLHQLRAEQPEGEPSFPQLPADLQARLDAVGVTDAESLQDALDADPDLKRDYLAFLEANQDQITQAWMAQLLAAFLAVPGSAALAEFWQQLPSEMEDAFLAAVEQAIAQAEQHGEHDLAAALRQRLDGIRQLQAAPTLVDTDDTLSQPLFAFLNARSLEDLRRLIDEHPQLLTDAVEPIFAALLEQYAGDQQALMLIEARRGLLQACREQRVEAVFAELQRTFEQPQPPPELRQALDSYLEQHSAAEQSQDDVSAWQAVVEAGEALFGPEFAEAPGINWGALRENLASAYNALANALSNNGDRSAAIDAYDHAILLQPDFAMWRRNRAGTLLALGRLDEAETEIAAARALEPDAPRLAELDSQLEQMRANTSINDPAFHQVLDRYLEQRSVAEQSQHDVSPWQAAVDAGERLLDPEFAETPGVNWDALRENLASAYNSLGIAREAAKDLNATLAAFDRAIALQPDVAMWRRNRAGTLIDLGRLDEAQAEIAMARALEPDATRLVELDGQLEQARTSGSVDTQESD